ncbi:hypothetical protein DZF91_38360 [Actinomadura logoneensis]|uniref:Uncharacterized protein n=1 Tax=Actinomadura logoneensis TaxID=2293572 RepID=A0A372J8T6_9ACTN|nr:hypothetical protein [Actinomadura logoneensis]RFU36411.1 hypothetical protein DZF91_38360 [Actinomadura logoneensis]
MFWRKQRKAWERLHPLHRQLAEEQRFSATLPAAEWAELATGLATHDQTITKRKWRLPPRAASVLVPVLRVLREDMEPGAPLGVTTDLRGAVVPDKGGELRGLQVRPPALAGSERFFTDPWLLVRAELRDGSVLELAVVDRVRQRRIRKKSRSGKIKHKVKEKPVRVVRATRRLPKGMAVARPAPPAPAWLAVTAQQKENGRTVLRATAKGPAHADHRVIELILTVTGELFRWTPPRRSAATPRRAR